MPRIINRKKQIENFVLLALSFMVIFTILAGVIFWNYSNSIYANSDHALKERVDYYEKNGMASGSKDPKYPVLTDSGDPEQDFIKRFENDHINTIYYDKEQKEIFDTGAMWSASTSTFVPRFFVPFSLSDARLGPQTIKIGKGYLRVQALVLKDNRISKKDNFSNAGFVPAKYINFYAEATDNELNLRHFQNLITWSFALAFVLAVMFAYFISRQNMKPVLKAWDQQQDFVNNAAHELRTPMSVIQGKLETMLIKPESTVRDQSEAIILSLSEVRRLNSLTDNMLTLAKTGSNMTKIEKEATDINEFLQKIVAPYQEMAMLDDKNVSLEVDVDREVAIDQRRIHQLLVLLLDNALKYSDAGAVVEVVASIERKRFILTVADTGRGISAEAKKYIFDRFYREDKTGNRETGGTGLGLSIAEWIVRAHNGRITVSDNQPQGTIFKVSLPL